MKELARDWKGSRLFWLPSHILNVQVKKTLNNHVTYTINKINSPWTNNNCIVIEIILYKGMFTEYFREVSADLYDILLYLFPGVLVA